MPEGFSTLHNRIAASPPFGGYLILIIKDSFLYSVIQNIDMKNASFSYLLPKSGSRSYS